MAGYGLEVLSGKARRFLEKGKGLLCDVSGCTTPAKTRGWCSKHYKRWAAHGDPNYTKYCPGYLSRGEKLKWHGWTERVVRSDLGPCWEFPKLSENGYGRICEKGGSVAAHRVAYEEHKGPIPEGLVVRHSCDNPPCVNPDHLLVGTNKDNTRDMFDRGRARRHRGEQHYAASLTWEQVREMRRLNAEFGVPQNSLSRLLGVNQSVVQGIIAGKTWKELGD